MNVVASVSEEDIPSTASAFRPKFLVHGVHAEQPPDFGYVTSLEEFRPDLRVLVVAEGAEPDLLKRALLSGVSGFVRAGQSPESFMSAMRQIAIGGSVLDPVLVRRLAENSNQQPNTANDAANLLSTLSDRDREILAAVARGDSNGRIAATLHLAEGTVRNRLGTIYRRLGISHRSQAAFFAARAGLL